ncbi:MAG: response regulator transcription factor [Eubacteriales bacterium]|nr:response regulator transcription factor [Eubacteriales bacterium]
MYRILLLEEDQEASCRVRDYLRISGCMIREVVLTSGLDYSDLMRKIDIVLLHCKHSEQLFYVCEELRTVSQLPVIVLSENPDEWAKIRMFQAGVDDYLVEPLSQGEMVARIKAHVNCYRRLTQPFGYIKVRGLEIEIFTRRVRINGKEIELTAKEFDVLLVLARSPEHVFTKDEIFSLIWQEDLGDGYYNSVAVYIKKLRRKIEKDQNNPQYIETVWGVGYRMRA